MFAKASPSPKSDKTSTEETLTKSQLKERGWTDGMIKHFLSEPDSTKRNLHNSKAPILLYNQSRVEQVEASVEFQERQERANKWRQVAEKVSERKRAELRRYIDEIPIEVERLPLGELYRRACNAYNDRKLARSMVGMGSPYPDDSRASLDSSEHFLQRIAVDRLRDGYTKYKEELFKVYGKVGAAEARERLERRVLQAIKEAYPELADECDDQRFRAKRDSDMADFLR